MYSDRYIQQTFHLIMTICHFRQFTLLDTFSKWALGTWISKHAMSSNSQPASNTILITQATTQNCFEWVVSVTCSQKEHLVSKGQGCEVRDMLRPLNQLEQLLIGCLANVCHCRLNKHRKSYKRSPPVTLPNTQITTTFHQPHFQIIYCNQVSSSHTSKLKNNISLHKSYI